MQPNSVPSTRSRSAIRSYGTRSLFLLFVLTACGGDEADGTAPDPSSAPAAGVTAPAGEPSQDVSGAEGSSDQIEVTLGEGPFAGTHRATGDMECFAQPGIWGASLTGGGDQAMSEVLLMLQGVPATGGSTQDVNFTITFGDPMQGTIEDSGLVGIGAVAGGGSGTGTVKREGGGAVIEVEGTTHYGAAISAVVRCATVEVVE